MSHDKLEKRIAQLESINDQLTCEFNHLNQILKKLGFDDGIKTLKEAAKEMLDKEPLSPLEEHNKKEVDKKKFPKDPDSV